MRRFSFLVTLAALITAIPAAAALAKAPDTDRLRAIGWNVAWGEHGDGAALPAGSEVHVRIGPSRRRPPRQRAVRVSLVRLGEDGARDRTVASRKVRRGTFRVKLPRGDGARYVLTVRAGRRTLRERLVTGREPADSGSGPLVPSGPKQPVDVCMPSSAAARPATIGFDRPSASAGEAVTLTVVNGSEGCLGGGYGFAWERLVAGTWQAVQTPPRPVPDIGVTLPPGTTFTESVTIERTATMPPGSYRAVKTWSLGPGSATPGQRLVQHAYLEIVTPPYPWPGPSPDRCGSGDHLAAATVVTDPARVVNGATVRVTVTNTGSVCLKSRSGFVITPVDGGPVLTVERDGSYVVDRPGEARSFQFTVPDAASMPPGRYKISFDTWVPPASDAITLIQVEGEFEVVAPED